MESHEISQDSGESRTECGRCRPLGSELLKIVVLALALHVCCTSSALASIPGHILRGLESRLVLHVCCIVGLNFVIRP